MCLHLTEEFRRLPKNHKAREDKLEVRLICFHHVFLIFWFSIFPFHLKIKVWTNQIEEKVNVGQPYNMFVFYVFIFFMKQIQKMIVYVVDSAIKELETLRSWLNPMEVCSHADFFYWQMLNVSFC